MERSARKRKKLGRVTLCLRQDVTPVFFPALKNPDVPVSAATLRTWLTRAKRRWLAAVPDEGRAALKQKLSRVGFHA